MVINSPITRESTKWIFIDPGISQSQRFKDKWRHLKKAQMRRFRRKPSEQDAEGAFNLEQRFQFSQQQISACTCSPSTLSFHPPHGPGAIALLWKHSEKGKLWFPFSSWSPPAIFWYRTTWHRMPLKHRWDKMLKESSSFPCLPPIPSFK